MTRASSTTSTAPHLRAWRRQRRLTAAIVTVLLFLGFALPSLVQMLNLVKIAGFPMGFYLAAQGIPVLLAAVVFFHARRANRHDRAPSVDAGRES